MGILNRLRAILNHKRINELRQTNSIELLDDFDNFRINIDDCIFLSSQNEVTRDTVSPEVGFWKNFDIEEKKYTNAIQIKISKNINGVEYNFISDPMLMDIDNVRFKIILGQNSYVFYSKVDPRKYYFQF